MRSILFASAILVAAPAMAAEIRTEPVRFAAGAESTLVEGRIAGDEIVDHLFGAEAEGHVEISMTSDNPSAFFNLIAPGQTDAAFFNGSVDGNVFAGELPTSGEYRIRVYLLRSAAQRSQSADYKLDIRIGAPDLAEPVKADYADGLQGGPDFWKVTGVTTRLNVREAPSTGAAVAGKVENGAVLRNLGCRMAEGRRWCRVESPDGQGPSGWTVGDFLVETGAPADAAEPVSAPEQEQGAGAPAASSAADRAGRGAFDAAGEISCSQVAGQPATSCAFGVARGPEGEAAMVVTRPDGTKRTLFFQGGRFLGADTSQAEGYPAYSATREGDLTVVLVGEERYEIPDAAIHGG